MSSLPYQDPKLPIAERVDDLVGRLTTEEKIAQLSSPLGWTVYTRQDGKPGLSAEGRALLGGDSVGGLYGLLRADPWTGVTAHTGLTPEEGAHIVNEVQEHIRNHTTHGIPTFVIGEGNHGYQALGGTTAPSLLMASCAWNPDLWEKMMAACGREMRTQGNSVAFCPNVDMARDPRWGRTEETAGEDPYLASRYAAAGVTGLQSAGIAACVKHFVHGAPESGLNTQVAHMGRHELHEIFLRPFRAAIAAGALGVMPSYNEVDGLPSSGNQWLLTDLLRDHLGFQGVTFSDVGAIGMLSDTYNRVADYREAAALSLQAGTDFETAQTRIYDRPLKDALQAGLVAMETIERSLRRVLHLKFQLGLFDRPSADPAGAKRWMGCSEHRALAREVACQGIVLLKNEGNLLPLAKDLGNLAVIGPNADNVYNQLGDYTAPQHPGDTVTVLHGIRAAVSKTTTVHYAQGCAIRDPNQSGFQEALDAAAKADAVVMVMGGSSARDFDLSDLSTPEAGAMTAERTSKDIECGEGLDRATLDLLGAQLALVQAVAALGKPVVVVLICGRPITIEWIREHIPAILVAWYPGQEGGNAIADILFGNASPSGKLTVSWPKYVGQLPLLYNRKRAVQNNYIEMDRQPAFPFGHGLSYTTFVFDPLKVERTSIGWQVTTRVRNTGKTAGDEVAQLYLSDAVSTLTRPEHELKGFQRVSLSPGESQPITFHLGPEELGFYDAEGNLRVEPGAFTLTLAPPHAPAQQLTFQHS